ncbi:MAG: CoA transferase, partial [Chloroflexota bacterium]
MTAEAGLPLSGYRILDLTHWGAGPVGVCHLADMGAEVIKVEEPGKGEMLRGLFSTGGIHTIFYPHPVNYIYELANRGKKCIAVDLRQPRGREVIYRLVPQCDALVSSLRKPALRRYGLDYPSLAALNPRLVYVHLSAFGPQGPDAELPGQDLVARARSGMINMNRPHPEAPPVADSYISMGDTIASLQLAYAAVLALLDRDRTGTGQEVDVSILGAHLAATEMLFQVYLATGKEPVAPQRTEMRNPIRTIYKCRDGKWLALGMTTGDKYWADFCHAIGRPELGHDPRFSSVEGRAQNYSQAIALLDEAFATRDRDEWCALFRERDLICAPVQSYGEVASDPQVLANDYVVEVDLPNYGKLKEVVVTVGLSKAKAGPHRPAPEMGQHTE